MPHDTTLPDRLPRNPPKHRRDVPWYLMQDDSKVDPISRARCINFGRGYCDDWRCPRHSSTAYADSMARHAADSLPGGWGR